MKTVRSVGKSALQRFQPAVTPKGLCSGSGSGFLIGFRLQDTRQGAGRFVKDADEARRLALGDPTGGHQSVEVAPGKYRCGACMRRPFLGTRRKPW